MVITNGKVLQCPECGNTENWVNVAQINGKTTATCGECGSTFTQ